MDLYEHQVKLLCLKQRVIQDKSLHSVSQIKRSRLNRDKGDFNLFSKLSRPYFCLDYLSQLISNSFLLLLGQALTNNQTNIHIVLAYLFIGVLSFDVEKLLNSLASNYDESAFLLEDLCYQLHQIFLTLLPQQIGQIYLSFQVVLDLCSLLSYPQSILALLITDIAQEFDLIVFLSITYLNWLKLVEEAIAPNAFLITKVSRSNQGFYSVFLSYFLKWQFQLSPFRYSGMKIFDEIKEIKLYEAIMEVKVLSIFNFLGLSEEIRILNGCYFMSVFCIRISDDLQKILGRQLFIPFQVFRVERFELSFKSFLQLQKL